MPETAADPPIADESHYFRIFIPVSTLIAITEIRPREIADLRQRDSGRSNAAPSASGRFAPHPRPLSPEGREGRWRVTCVTSPGVT